MRLLPCSALLLLASCASMPVARRPPAASVPARPVASAPRSTPEALVAQPSPPAPVRVAPSQPAPARAGCARLAVLTEAALARAVPRPGHPAASRLRTTADLRRGATVDLDALPCTEVDGEALGFFVEEAAVPREGVCWEPECVYLVARVVFGWLSREETLATSQLDLGMRGDEATLPRANCCDIYGVLEVDALRVWRGDDGARRVLVHTTQEGNEGHHVESAALWRAREGALEPVALPGVVTVQQATRQTRLVDAVDVDRDGRLDLVVRERGREHCSEVTGFCYLAPGALRWMRSRRGDRWSAPARPPRGWRR